MRVEDSPAPDFFLDYSVSGTCFRGDHYYGGEDPEFRAFTELHPLSELIEQSYSMRIGQSEIDSWEPAGRLGLVLIGDSHFRIFFMAATGGDWWQLDTRDTYGFADGWRPRSEDVLWDRAKDARLFTDAAGVRLERELFRERAFARAADRYYRCRAGERANEGG
ncbi:MAG: hypothetical protein LBT54_07425 [Bifidobacteriaceae bacterium]|nr:hypothetical protein [Bifidobacteriaceae bacterium]